MKLENNLNRKNYRVAAVVVTYNRLSLLKECITAIRNQTHKLDEIIIVNNSSTDGTFEWLSEQSDLTVITQSNSGSAGGQHTGIKTAYEKGHDWIWCMDDDVYAKNSALTNLITFINNCVEKREIGYIVSKVVNNFGELHDWNRPGYFWNKNYWNFIGFENTSIESTRIDVCSFVSVLFNANAVSKVGFPNKYMFLYFDDLEYTLRFRKYLNFFIANSIVTHYSLVIQSSNFHHELLKKSDTAFFYFRNLSYIYWKHNKLFLLKELLRPTDLRLWYNVFGKIKLNYFTLLIKAVYKGIQGNFE